MDPGTGQIYPTPAAARADGVAHPVELRGRAEDVKAIAAAVAEARRPVDDTHECPETDCTLRVRANLLACRDHWALVTPRTKRDVYSAYRASRLPGGAARHHDAMQAAIREMNGVTP